eukprot:TRINITY_DN49252_c0_g1_i1.p1 TRINITY_DN49252_c0_g1~~TRINITY_DN49252_c0_g1_i1.p1  ORF type:complete len:320 (-),score=56.87 TRINITY_DN49252_c0_g1_i1:48-1007(-)
MGSDEAWEPTSMRAVQRSGGGIRLADAVPIPKLKPGSVLVKVKAAAINPVDYKLPRFVGRPVGLDLAGTVAALGAGCTAFSIGDEVYGNVAPPGGALADYCLCEASKIAAKPSALSFQEAAALPTVGLTGLQAMHCGGLTKGARVLVIGASGGCGTAAVQIAKALGAIEVVGVCSAHNAALVIQLGADRVIDYSVETIHGTCGTNYFDIVYDAATNSGGGEMYIKQAKRSLKPGGQYVAINAPGIDWLRMVIGCQRRNFQLILTKHKSSDLAVLTQLVDAGQLKLIIDCSLTLTQENLDQGFSRLKSRRAKGKVVFTLE